MTRIANLRRSGGLALAALVVAGISASLLWQRSTDPLAPPAIGDPEREQLPLGTVLDIDALDASGRPRVPPGARIEASAPRDPAHAAAAPVTDDMAVLDMLELLGPRARAGDPVAACELAGALGQCRMQALMRAAPPPPPPVDVDHPAFKSYVDREASRQEWAERLSRRCDGIGRDALAEGASFTAQAAVNGHLPSLLDFLHMPNMAAGDFIRSPALTDAYRTQLWPLLRRAFAEGHLATAHAAMVQLALPVAGPLSGVVPAQYQDPEAARALLAMLRDAEGLAPPSLHQLTGNPEPPSEQAIATAQRWIDELFGGRLPTRQPPLATRLGTGPGSTCHESDSWLQPPGA
jgi:hypothetical protein